MELTGQQLLLISSVLTVVLWFVTVVYMGLLKKPKPAEEVLKAGTIIGGFVFSVIFVPFDFGAFIDGFVADPIATLTTLFVWLVAVATLAQVIYVVIWQRLTDGLGKNVSFLSFLSTKR